MELFLRNVVEFLSSAHANDVSFGYDRLFVEDPDEMRETGWSANSGDAMSGTEAWTHGQLKTSKGSW